LQSIGLNFHKTESAGDILKAAMPKLALYPLRFDPIYQYRIWGGRALQHWLKQPLPDKDTIGEAWVLSDREDNPSRVLDGPLKGWTISELMAQAPDQLMGKWAGRFQRFPLLLKFLDVRKMLSIQVHPPDGRADLIPAGETGKTEAWVVLEAGPRSRVYAGLKDGATAQDLRALSIDTVDDHVASFTPRPGQAVLIEAGVVHSLGDGLVVIEVQENSDVTFRLFDWNHIDPKTGRQRPLQVDQALACVDFASGPVGPVRPVSEAQTPVSRELLVDCPHFRLWRTHGQAPFTVGAAEEPTVLVGVEGAGHLEFAGARWALERGGAMLLPAEAGECRFQPDSAMAVLEIRTPGPS
jgi:mannose-6-phosphate isomerase